MSMKVDAESHVRIICRLWQCDKLPINHSDIRLIGCFRP